MTLRTLCLFLLAVTTVLSCDNDAADATSSSATDPIVATPDPEPAATSVAPTVLVPWVDQLNMRDEPSTSGKVVAKLPIRSELTVTGNESEKAETIVLRGVAYTDRWYEVMTTDDQKGWVFGGAVRNPDEIKGNAPLNDKQINFPIFGAYNLDKWDLIQPATTTAGGDAETVTTKYRDDRGQILTIEKTTVGEYGYTDRYVLESGQDYLKVRELTFTTNLGDPDGTHELTERVEDYLNSEVYVRSQQIDKHYMSLNAYPRMVRGEWQKKPLTGVPEEN